MGTLRLSSSCPGWFGSQCGVRYDIRVPEGTSVRARSSRRGHRGARAAQLQRPSSCTPRRATSAPSRCTAPALDLSTSAGDVEADAIRCPRVPAAIRRRGTWSGALLEVADTLDAGTSAGDVELLVPDAPYRLDAGHGTRATSRARGRPDRPVLAAGDPRSARAPGTSALDVRR